MAKFERGQFTQVSCAAAGGGVECVLPENPPQMWGGRLLVVCAKIQSVRDEIGTDFCIKLDSNIGNSML